MSADTVAVARDDLHELLVYLTACDEMFVALNHNTDYPQDGLMTIVERAFNRHLFNGDEHDDHTWNRAFAAVQLDAYDVAANMLDEMLGDRDERLGLGVLFDDDSAAAWPAVRRRLRERRDELRTWANDERERRNRARIGVVPSDRSPSDE